MDRSQRKQRRIDAVLLVLFILQSATLLINTIEILVSISKGFHRAKLLADRREPALEHERLGCLLDSALDTILLEITP